MHLDRYDAKLHLNTPIKENQFYSLVYFSKSNLATMLFASWHQILVNNLVQINGLPFVIE